MWEMGGVFWGSSFDSLWVFRASTEGETVLGKRLPWSDSRAEAAM